MTQVIMLVNSISKMSFSRFDMHFVGLSKLSVFLVFFSLQK